MTDFDIKYRLNQIPKVSSTGTELETTKKKLDSTITKQLYFPLHVSSTNCNVFVGHYQLAPRTGILTGYFL